MRPLLILLIVSAVLIAGSVGLGLRQYLRLWPKPSAEVITLSADKRKLLTGLRAERKFRPHSFPPLGYTGAPTPAAQATASLAVDGVIDEVLARPDGPLPAKVVARLIGKGMKTVRSLETEDRDRTQDYMLEVWYLLGFKGATGRFAYGSYYKTPAGYGEPLPPGWISPTQPRPTSN